MSSTIQRQRLQTRFLDYVAIPTTANPDTHQYPSSPGQWQLGRRLVEELRAMGVTQVEQTPDALVLATIPATRPARDGHAPPVIAWNAHLDTSPEAPGEGVRPQVLDNYAGGDIVLPGDRSQVIRVAENPELDQLLGCTLITTDGTTLLGGDDKAGIAVIMEAAAYLMEHPAIPHGDIRLLFTCDEEIGRGVDRVNLQQLAADVAYTLDGPGANSIDVETFSAHEATVTFTGVNIHPSIAQHRMVNALKVGAAFITALPRDRLAPEVTAGPDGFVHPYRLLEGQVDRVVLKVLLRDFETAQLHHQADLLRQIADRTAADFPGCRIDIAIQEQYRNLGEGLGREPRAVKLALLAHERLGRTAELARIRGGTDGSRLTELGLPTPNLSTGQHNPHSPLEWVCLEEMLSAAEVLIELARLWGAE